MDFGKVLDGFQKYPKPENISLSYGTAGFRASAAILNHVAFRVGILAGLRAKVTRKVIGLMVTASHNPSIDNGVKLIDPNGDMLEITWEPLATTFVNSNPDEIEKNISNVVSSYKIDVEYQGKVILGWDTRPSSETLVAIACEGISSVNSTPIRMSLCTTPSLHYLVKCNNDSLYGVPTVEGYYDKLVTAFETLWKTVSNTNGNYLPEINFDGANGVGSLAIESISDRLADKLKINVYNDDIRNPEKLNHQCGADFIKQAQQFPHGLPTTANVRCVSFDGDADRIMYFYLDDTSECRILDGDKMAVLFATFLKDVIKRAQLSTSFGIIQTAYANGSSTKYISEKLNIEVFCAKTGVKYLHHKALEYDIGIYFEANGHGTILFSDKLKTQLADALKTAEGEQLKALNQLSTFIDIINETIGDALSDMLAIESILHLNGWSLQDWNAFYEPLPYKMTKVTIKDRNVITTTDAERKCLTPPELQPEIDKAISMYSSARSFVRPSGTEDLVRVYAEAATQQQADELAVKVSQLVYDLAGGVGERP